MQYRARALLAANHAAHAAHWAMTGGGSLLRMGCHPLSTVLYLKQVEAKARGEAVSVASVICDVGNVAACLRSGERAFIKANPTDVEDWGMLTVTFSDGTKAAVFSADMRLVLVVRPAPETSGLARSADTTRKSSGAMLHQNLLYKINVLRTTLPATLTNLQRCILR